MENVSRQHIANRARTIVQPAPWYVGIRRPDYFLQQRNGLPTEIVAVGLDGTPVAGVPVEVTVIRSRDPDADQPFCEQLVAEIGKGYDLLLVESLNRISRGAATLNLLDEAERRGVRVVAVADEFDSCRDAESDLTPWLLTATTHGGFALHCAGVGTLRRDDLSDVSV